MNGQEQPPPLEGIRVVDLTTFLSGPFCTQILADLGADVVKVESPHGDSSRHIPPHFVGDDSAYFLANNRTKRSIAIDMKKPDGVALVRRMIGHADIVVENFRPGVCARLGLDIEAIRAEQPALIWASITGFGLDGPMAQRPAYDMIVQALSGVMSLTGEPGQPSVRLGIPAGDTVAGLYATIAINAALAQRATTGLGRHIDIGMLDCQLSMLAYQSAYALIGGVTPGPQGARHDSIPTYRAFTARDGRQVAVTANTERMWQGLCASLDREDLLADDRFANAKARLANKDALWEQLEPAFLKRDAMDWSTVLTQNDVPNALVKTVPEALDDARQSGREMILNVDDGDGHAIKIVGSPIRMGEAVPAPATYPPTLGRDVDAVLSQWLNLQADEIGELGARGIVYRKDPAS